MVGQTAILFLVVLEVLLHPPLHAHVDIIRLTGIILIMAFKHEERFCVTNDLRVYWGGAAAAERHVVNSVKKVGLARPIGAYEAIHLGGKAQANFLQVLIVDNANLFQYHNKSRCKVTRFESEKQKK